MLRYLFVHQNFPAQYVHVTRALAAQGHEVVALCVNQPSAFIPGVRYVRYTPAPLGTSTAKGDLGNALRDWQSKVARGHAAARALKHLRDEGFRPDVITAHPGWGEALFIKDVYPEARLVTYAEFYYGTDSGDSNFDPEFIRTSDCQSEILRVKNTHLLHALNDCDAAVSPTHFQMSRHPRWAHSKIAVVHEGIDTERFKPDSRATVRLEKLDLELKVGDEVVTFVARNLEPYRGYHIFMRALPLLQKLHPNAVVVIIGAEGTSYGAKPADGQSWKRIFLREVAPRLDLNRVRFVGQVPHSLLTRLMQVSAAHVYLTYPFVLSWSFLEAMSIGCCVIGSDTAPVKEVLKDGENGFLTDFFDHERLAVTIAKALAAGPDVQQARSGARQTIMQKYDLHRVCLPKHLDLLGGPGQGATYLQA